MKVKQIIENLKPSQKYIITISVLNEETLNVDTNVESHNFLTGDLPIARNTISKLLYEMHQKQITVKDDSVIEQEKSENKIKSILE